MSSFILSVGIGWNWNFHETKTLIIFCFTSFRFKSTKTILFHSSIHIPSPPPFIPLRIVNNNRKKNFEKLCFFSVSLTFGAVFSQQVSFPKKFFKPPEFPQRHRKCNRLSSGRSRTCQFRGKVRFSWEVMGGSIPGFGPENGRYKSLYMKRNYTSTFKGVPNGSVTGCQKKTSLRV